MSSFKKLSKSDVTTVPYYANKQWTLAYSIYPTSSDYLTIFKGTNLAGDFDSNTDPVTENQYERLIYSQINQLFFQQYTESLDTSSLANSLYYESASQQRPTNSYFIHNDNSNFIKYFPTGVNEGIRVLAINQEVFGNKILPNHFILTSSAYKVVDDGYGNLFDTKTSRTHIGSIFYAQGLAIITNQDYQLMFPLPPLAVNDNASFLTTDSPKTLSAVANDSGRGGTLVNSSLTLSGSTSELSYWTNNGDGTVTLNTSIAGSYVIYYTVQASYAAGNLTSNKGRIIATVSDTTTTSTTTTTTTAAPTTTTTTSTTTTTTTVAPTTTTSTTTTTTTVAGTTTSTTTTTTTIAPTTTTTTTTTTSTTTTTTTIVPTTTTSTTTTTTTINYNYYTADRYSCSGGSCGTLQESSVTVAASSTLTVGRWYVQIGTSVPYSELWEITGIGSYTPAVPIMDSASGALTCNAICVQNIS